jgi:hypothetical protein
MNYLKDKIEKYLHYLTLNKKQQCWLTIKEKITKNQTQKEELLPSKINFKSMQMQASEWTKVFGSHNWQDLYWEYKVLLINKKMHKTG